MNNELILKDVQTAIDAALLEVGKKHHKRISIGVTPVPDALKLLVQQLGFTGVQEPQLVIHIEEAHEPDSLS